MNHDSNLCATLWSSDPPVVSLEGGVDHSNQNWLARFLSDIRGAGVTHTRLDLTELSFADSFVLTVIKGMVESFERLEICAPPHIAEVLETYGLGDFLCEDGEMSHQEELGTVWVMISFLLPAKLDCCHVARERVARVAAQMLVPEEGQADINTAVGEAVSNAIRHGCGNDELQQVGVRCLANREWIAIEVSDTGPGFDPEKVPCPDLSALPESGMGIYCIKQVMDEVSYDFSGGTTVRLVKRARVPDAV